MVSYDATATSHKCVRLINEYWIKRGYHVSARVDHSPIFFGGKNYSWPVICSNTINGSPVGYAR
jgi:hypothetical protein